MKKSSLFEKRKKGQVEEMVEQIPYILLTIIVIVGIYLLLNYATNPEIDVSQTQASVFVYRTIYASNSISQVDEVTNRVHPGIVVDEKFTSQSLDSAMQYSYEKQIAAKLEIYLDRKQEPIRTAYYNQKWYERLEPVAFAKLTGVGSASFIEKEVPIVLRQPGADFPATLKFTIIIPK